jgi:hypothetical protein
MPDTLRAAAILAFVIILVYGEVCFLGYTLSPAINNSGVLSGFQYGYEGREPYNLYVMDPLATGGTMWPVYETVSRALVSGRIPLWNPYQGIGAPLAADTTWDAYYPLNILYAIPNQYWDFVWFLKLWLAGLFCYVFLRDLRLSPIPSLGGSLAYCLSGAFIFNPLTPWTDVAVLTPVLLLSTKKCFDRPLSASPLIMGSVALATSILGAHIEALVIQFLFVTLFVMFEAIFVQRKGKIRGVITWTLTVALGFALAAFFLLPVLEYLSIASLGHSGDVGVHSLSTDGNPVTWLLTLFVPYFFGFLQTYPYQGLRQVFFWDISPGYLGTTILFLTSVALFSLDMRKPRERASYTVFFLGAGSLVLLKIFGVPPVNWIGYLPVLSHVIFSRYSGSVLAMSFSGACAYGLQSVLDRTSSRQSLRRATIFASAVLILAAAASMPIIASPAVPIVPWMPFPLFLGSMSYLILSVTFLSLSYIATLTGGISGARILAILVILELVCYVPMSLPLGYEVARVGVCTGTAIVLALYSRRPTMSPTSWMVRRIPAFQEISREQVFGVILVAALVLQSGVAAASPRGLPNRYDAFAEAPYLSFLKANVGEQRVYSLDGALFPPVAGVFGIQHLGEFSAFMPYSFREFSLVNLDRGAVTSTLAGNAWAHKEIPDASFEIRENIEFYSLLGVKYFVTAYTDLSLAHVVMIKTELPLWESAWTSLGNKSFSTSLSTDQTFDSVLVRMKGADHASTGSVTITIDSTPYRETLHRQARVDAQSVSTRAPVEFSFARVDVDNTTEFRMTLTQSNGKFGNEVAIMILSQATQQPHLTVSDSFQIGNETRDGYAVLGVGLHEPFLPVAYADQNVTIYENPMAFPRTFLVNNFLVVTSQKQAILKTSQLGWNTTNILVIEEMPSSEEVAAIHRSPQEATRGSAQIERYSENEVVILSKTDAPTFLVLTDIYYPGWTCYVDGRPVKIYRAYGAVRAVFINAESQEIVFKYEPNSFRTGLLITVLSMVIIFLCAIHGVSGIAKGSKRILPIGRGKSESRDHFCPATRPTRALEGSA